MLQDLLQPTRVLLYEEVLFLFNTAVWQYFMHLTPVKFNILKQI